MLSRGWHLAGHLQTQQGYSAIAAGCLANRLEPASTDRRRNATAQLLRRGHQGRIASLPGCQDLSQRLTVRLGCKFAQGKLSMLYGISLRPKSGVSQAWCFLPRRRRTKALVAPRPAWATVICASRRLIVPRGPLPVSGAVLALTKFPATPGWSGFGLLHARAIIAAHRAHRLCCRLRNLLRRDKRI